jgi:hypothetical protein
MSQVLSLSLRPRTLSQMVGQKTLVDSIRKQMGERVPQAILLTGVTGGGKTTLARIIAIALQCPHQKLWGDPCEPCANASFSIHEINASDNNGVEELSRVAETARYAPVAGKYRVFILDEVQRLSSASMGMLLKHTEEPVKSTVWIFCTTDPQKLLPTLRRRFVEYQVKGLGPNGIELLLKRGAASIKCDKPLPPLIDQIRQQQVTSPALVLMALEKYASGFSPEESVVSGEANAETLAICKAVIGGRVQELSRLLQTVTAEQSRLVQASVAGYLRSCLFREGNLQKADRIALGMQELVDGRSPLDDKQLLNWVIGILWKVTRRLGQ